MDKANKNKSETDIKELLEEGLERFGEGDWEGALAKWKQVSILDPGNTKAIEYRQYVKSSYGAPSNSDELEPKNELSASLFLEEDESSEVSIDSGYETMEFESASDSSFLDDGWTLNDAWVDELEDPSDESKKDELEVMSKTTQCERLSAVSLDVEPARVLIASDTRAATVNMNDGDEDLRLGEAGETIQDLAPIMLGGIGESNSDTMTRNADSDIEADSASEGEGAPCDQSEVRSPSDEDSQRTDDALLGNAKPDDVEDSELRTVFIVKSLIGHAIEKYDMQEFGAASVAVVSVILLADDNAIAQKLIYSNETKLTQILMAGLCKLNQVLVLFVPLQELQMGDVDHRAAFLLSRIDGVLTLEEILDISGMSKLETLSHLSAMKSKNYLKIK